MKSERRNTSLMWPSIVAAAVFAMLVFMIVADPAAGTTDHQFRAHDKLEIVQHPMVGFLHDYRVSRGAASCSKE